MAVTTSGSTLVELFTTMHALGKPIVAMVNEGIMAFFQKREPVWTGK